MTPAQLQTLKTFIAGDATLNAFPQNSDGAYSIAWAINLAATPAFIVWRHDVSAQETGDAWVGTDIDGMSALNMQRLQLLLASSPGSTFDMRRVDRRAGFENPFGASTSNPSRVAMRAVWKRSASVFEKLFATGAGSDAAPGTLVLIGPVSYQEAQTAREA